MFYKNIFYFLSANFIRSNNSVEENKNCPMDITKYHAYNLKIFYIHYSVLNLFVLLLQLLFNFLWVKCYFFNILNYYYCNVNK